MPGTLNVAASRALLGVVSATTILSALVAAQRFNVTYNGDVYELYRVNGSANTLRANLTSTFWWGNSTAAQEVAGQVKFGLGLGYKYFLSGYGDYELGAFFAYGDYNANLRTKAWESVNNAAGSVAYGQPGANDLRGYALSAPPYQPSPPPSPSPEASPSPSPEASPSASPEASPSASPEASPSASPESSLSPSPEASPSASPESSLSPSPEASPSPVPLSLDCSLAVFSPPILSSRVTGQICAANKAVRQGKQSKLVTNVTLSLMDANNQPAAINITDIVTNKLTAGWQCKCRPTGRDNCTCLPNAVLLGGGNFLVFPQWRRSTRPGGIVDTTLQVSFSATAGDGGTCNGTAVICSAWGVRRNQPPPACAPFNSTGVTRPALSCI